jgi:hypothetical protein
MRFRSPILTLTAGVLVVLKALPSAPAACQQPIPNAPGK